MPGRRRQLPSLTACSPGHVLAGPRRPAPPSGGPVVRHLPALPRRHGCEAARRRPPERARAAARFSEHLGGYAMHELRDFTRHCRRSVVLTRPKLWFSGLGVRIEGVEQSARSHQHVHRCPHRSNVVVDLDGHGQKTR